MEDKRSLPNWIGREGSSAATRNPTPMSSVLVRSLLCLGRPPTDCSRPGWTPHWRTARGLGDAGVPGRPAVTSRLAFLF